MAKQMTIFERKQELVRLLAEAVAAAERAHDIVGNDPVLKRQFEGELDELRELLLAIQEEIEKFGIG